MNSFGIAPGARRYVAIWLYTVAVMIFAMVVLGGLTRLTESGLSMVDWQPLMGAIPPLNEADWQAVFHDYKQYPEYKLHNTHMTLSEFKFIFYMEYSHRVLGRLIGSVFLFPFLFFLFKRWLSARWIRRFTVLFVLGGLQGVVGWYMVKSGLVDVPHVSQYRLVLHLSMAILVFSLSLWYAFALRDPYPDADTKAMGALRSKLTLLLWIVGLQILTGGFVAGLKAGIVWYTWLIPQGLFGSSTLIENLFENPITILFIHRCFAVVVATLVITATVRYHKVAASSQIRTAWYLLTALVAVQVSLGVSLIIMKVPVSLASAHQAVALLLWAVLLFLCRIASPEPIAQTDAVSGAAAQPA